MNLEQTADVTTKGEDQGIIKKMLIAVDESEYREKIIRYGLALSKSLRAEVIAVHVVDRSSLASASDLGGLLGYYEGGNLEYYEEKLRKHAEDLLGEVGSFAKKEGVNIDTEVIMNASSAAEGIINYASSKNVDLVVIGTKGMTGAKKFLMGSVTSKVATHAQCSVLAVR